MANKQTSTIAVNVDVIGKLDNFSKALKIMESQLGNLNLGPQLSESFTTSFKKAFKEIEKASELTAGGKLKLVDEKVFQKTVSNIENIYDDLINKLEKHGVKTSLLK